MYEGAKLYDIFIWVCNTISDIKRETVYFAMVLHALHGIFILCRITDVSSIKFWRQKKGLDGSPYILPTPIAIGPAAVSGVTMHTPIKWVSVRVKSASFLYFFLTFKRHSVKMATFKHSVFLLFCLEFLYILCRRGTKGASRC